AALVTAHHEAEIEEAGGDLVEADRTDRGLGDAAGVGAGQAEELGGPVDDLADGEGARVLAAPGGEGHGRTPGDVAHGQGAAGGLGGLVDGGAAAGQDGDDGALGQLL